MKTWISILHIYLLKIMIQKKTDFNYTNEMKPNKNRIIYWTTYTVVQLETSWLIKPKRKKKGKKKLWQRDAAIKG